jgi:DNA-binding transcriptional ArsR family regulator
MPDQPPHHPPDPEDQARPGERPDADSAVPRRELRDPRVLRALSHPLRLSLLEELASSGQATATELAERVGESPANCSWHLRQLARYGLIEEAGGGTGRQRPWKWVAQSLGVADAGEDDEPEFSHALEALMEVLMSREFEAWQAWRASRHTVPKPWLDASFGTHGLNWLTADELAAFKRACEEVIDRHIMSRVDRADPTHRPSDARPVRIVAWAFPAGSAPARAGTKPADPTDPTDEEERP